MYRGEIVEQGPIDSIFADPQHPHTRALLAAVPPDAVSSSFGLTPSVI
jgi:ABC-type dipeptide/oligopeptide/nickel transport system ATPase component